MTKTIAMAIDKDVLDQLRAGREPQELFAKDGVTTNSEQAWPATPNLLDQSFHHHGGEPGARGRPPVHRAAGATPTTVKLLTRGAYPCIDWRPGNQSSCARMSRRGLCVPAEARRQCRLDPTLFGPPKSRMSAKHGLSAKNRPPHAYPSLTWRPTRERVNKSGPDGPP